MLSESLKAGKNQIINDKVILYYYALKDPGRKFLCGLRELKLIYAIARLWGSFLEQEGGLCFALLCFALL